nr:unnamed protein product [Callosobruchus analis]
MPPTRQGQAEFEQTLIDALKKKNIAESISNIILETITSALNDKFSYYDSKIAQLEAEVSELRTKFADSNSIPAEGIGQKSIQLQLDSVQQHSRNNNLRIVRVPEADDQNLNKRVYDIIKDRMKIKIDESDIVAAYRVGQKVDNKPRHVLVSFKDNAVKMDVYKNKRLLKGTSSVIKEDLTAFRLKALRAAADKHGYKNVWSVNGNLFLKTSKGVEKINLS